jgi:16S rRNA (cytidine1402-2'-O)-methyltransferase
MQDLTTDSGTLYVVATPIGNLEDLSARARRILQEVDLIAAEDTRHSGQLLAHFGIKTRQFALHDHNEAQAVSSLIDRLRNGDSVALISDAGTPLVSDPGFRLVSAARASGIPVAPVPGACAAIAALSVAGLPSDRFVFEGFLPAKRDARQRYLKTLRFEARSMIYFESVHRIDATLQDLVTCFGHDRPAFLGRELTKRHEQCLTTTTGQLLKERVAESIPLRGEFVLVVGGATEDGADADRIDARELLAELLVHVPGSQAVDIVARLSGRKRNQVYREMLALTQASTPND